MRAGKIALWLFIALLISGVVCGMSFLADIDRMGGWNKVVFGIGTQYSVNDAKDMDLAGFRRIEISVSSSDTKLAFTNSQKVTALLSGEVRATNPDAVPYLEMKASGDTLYINVKRKAAVSVGFFSSSIKLDVGIPSGFSGDLSFSGSSSRFETPSAKLNSLNVHTSSGDISLGNLDLAQDFIAETSSGQLSMGSLKANYAKVSSSSGDKKIGFVILSGDGTFETSSGKTTVEGISAGSTFIRSSSGDIIVGAAGTGKTTVRTSSGRIDVRGIDGSADVSATSGDITLKFLKPGAEINAVCSSGKVQVGLPSDAQFTLNAHTSSGSIKSDFTLNNINTDKRSLHGQVGNGQSQINLSTSSGNINVGQN